MILAKYLGELTKWYGSINTDSDWGSIQIIKKIESNLGLIFMPELEEEGNVCMVHSPEVRNEYKQTFTSINLLDYIYAVLYSPDYRKKGKECLDIDFSQVPYPVDLLHFWNFAGLGSQLRQLHLLESPKVEEFITSYPKEGDNTITANIGESDWELIANAHDGLWEEGRIWINEAQYFDNIPLVAWEFHINGYRPAQKWLKDRMGGTLSFEDIQFYQRMIVALTETDRLIQEIAIIAKTTLQKR
ncbi:type ISP restriction/modification enzyme [Arenibacter catalasegens]|nr:type ISP restriction/modification enzyme [Arenibacter catalasegens]